MAPIHFYLHFTAANKTGQPPLKLQYGPYASGGEAQAKFPDLTQEPGYEHTVRIRNGSAIRSSQPQKYDDTYGNRIANFEFP